VRSPRSSGHYFLDDTASRESFTEDGYFLTGDLVELRPGGRVRILGRRKLFFKLAGAEFVSPEPLERAFGKSALVEHVLVTALPTASQVAAVVVPVREGITEEELLRDLRRIAREDGLRACEVPAGVVVVERCDGEPPWTATNGMLTPSYKLNRRALEARYAGAIAAAYAGGSAPDASPGGESESVSESTAARLRRVVAAVLGTELAAVDLDATFAENGGTSLSSMELLLRLEEVFADKSTGRSEEAFGSERMLQELATSPLRALVARLDGSQGATSDAPAAGGGAAAERPRRAADATDSSSSARATTRPAPQASPEPAAAPAIAAPRGPGEDAAVAALASADALDVPPLPPGLPEAESFDVLVTGATGLLGAHLVARLARTLPPGARVLALARASDHAAAAARVAEAAARYELELPEPAPFDRGDGARAGARVVGVAGQLERERFGLPEEDWASLARRVGEIQHLGAAVDHFGGYPLLREANVLGTRRALELATTTTRKAFHFVSSINVAMILGQLGARSNREELPLPPSVPAETIRRNAGYAVTKLVAERLVDAVYERLAEERGAAPRFSISRPSLISWSPATGFSNPQDWLSRLLTSCLLMRAVPGGEEVGLPFWIAETETSARGLDMVPVDWVATAVARLSDLTRRCALPPPPSGAVERTPTFHVCNTAPGERGLVAFQRLVDLLALADVEVLRELPETHLRPMRRLPRARWLLETEVQGVPFRPFVRRLKQSPPSMARAVTTRFAAAMAGEAPCPGFDVAMVAPYVRRHHGLPAQGAAITAAAAPAGEAAR
jgi:fatty acid CoA ligase FadD9